MDLREFLKRCDNEGLLKSVSRTVSPHLEASRVLFALEGHPAIFRHVQGSDHPVVAGVCASRRLFALGLGCFQDALQERLTWALENPQSPPVVDQGRCQEVIEDKVDLESIPLLTHWPNDAGPYATAAVCFIHDPVSGPSAAFHRLLRLNKRTMAARLVEGRGTHVALNRSSEDLPVAICIGLPPHILLAAAMSPAPEIDELSIAQALAPTPLVQCRSVPLQIPACSEYVLEGRITHRTTAEGPFVDLTETYDIVRQQAVIEIDLITHRQKPIYQALLPGGLEHKMLMGLPREPTIFAAVSQKCQCLAVHVTPGGASWLHAVIQIEKQKPDDGHRAALAAFRGHSSLKHVIVVDADVDPYDMSQVEWAMATRFQADTDLTVLCDQPSSSLDPSALQVPGAKARTAKMALDATIPWDTPTGPSQPRGFLKVPMEPVHLSDYLDLVDG